MRTHTLTIIAALIVPAVARAQDAPAPVATKDDAGDGRKRGVGGDEDIETDAKEQSADVPVTVGGRVFARGEIADTDAAPWTGQLSLASARIGVSYRWKDRLRVKAVVEAAGGDAEIRDAFVETTAAEGTVTIRAGRFKGVVSAIERESAWRLPTIDRGAIAEVLEGGIALAGRRNGVAVSWEPVPIARVVAVASQSMATSGDEPARPLADGAGVSVALRGELDVAPGVRLGAFGSNREVNDVADVARYWAGGLDAEIDLSDAGLGLRLWADVLAGTSHLAATDADPSTAFFVAQLVAGWRFGGTKKGRRYVEPYVLGAYLNPDVDHRRDDVTDVAVGVAAGRWKRWRVQTQLSVVNAKANRPTGLLGFDEDLDDRVSATIQLGAAF